MRPAWRAQVRVLSDALEKCGQDPEDVLREHALDDVRSAPSAQVDLRWLVRAAPCRETAVFPATVPVFEQNVQKKVLTGGPQQSDSDGAVELTA